MLRVILAGGVRAELDGQGIDERLLGGRQGRRLLAHLAWEGRAVHREELADGIWPNTLPRTWERTMSGVVTRLRTGLAEAGVLGDVISYADGSYYLVGGGKIEVDVTEAAADLVSARQAASRGALEQALDLIQSVLVAARLPLMPGEDAPWADAARVRHRALLFEALDLLADTGVAAGQFSLAERAAREGVHWDPLREAGHQRLMRILSEKGDSAAALGAYSACRRLLADELGVDPSPETEAMYVRLLGVPEGLTDRPPAVRSIRPGRATFPSALHAFETTLVGRDAALSWLWSLWRQARPDAPLTAVLHGPPGAGKHSVAAVFGRELYVAGASVRYSHERDVEQRGVHRIGSAPMLAIIENDAAMPAEELVQGASLVLVLSSTPGVEIRHDADFALGALDRGSVTAMMDDRLGRSAAADEIDEMCNLTGGWPGAIEIEIGVRAEARSRELASDAATAAATLAAARFDLADELLRRKPHGGAAARAALRRTPYKGLLRFEAEDADLFFGRERLVADLLARLSTSRILVIVGASGSGKSSLVRAGVIAELRDGALHGSEQWPVALLTPGRLPAAALADGLRTAIAAAPSVELDELVDGFGRDGPCVIVVDQLEELFTLGTSQLDRETFIAALVRCISNEQLESRVVLVLRSDFYGACSAMPALADLVSSSQVVISAPTDLELRRMITLPARSSDAMLQSGLVDEVVTDVGRAPGALPLMSTALLEAWRRCEGWIGHEVTIEAYRAAGGVSGAIATLAEVVWTSLLPAQQRIARSMLLRLAGSDDAAADVGMPVERVELVDPGDSEALDVLDQFVQRRLITVDGPQVRVAHEALLREWPRLRGWLDDDRDTREVLHHLRRAAADWHERGSDQADLYRGTRLGAALDLHAEIDLSERERSFLAASSAQRTNEIDSLRRRGRRQVAFLVTLAVLLVVASVTGVIAIARQRQAAKLARVAVGRQLVQEAGTATGLDLRLLLAVEARRLDDTVEARGALLDLLTQANPVTAFLHTGKASFSAVAMSSDGSLLATGGIDGTVSVWRLPSHDLVGTMPLLSDRITTIAFSGDNELAAGDDTGEVARWGLSGTQPKRFEAHATRVLSLAYGASHSLITVGADALMRAFSMTTGESLWSRSLPPGAVAGTFDAHGSTYAQIRADGTVSMVDIGAASSTVTVAATAKENVTTMALAADGLTLAFGTNSGDVQLVSPDSRTTRDLGRVAAQGVDAGVAGVDALAFTSSGDVVATAGGTIAWLSATDATRSETLQLVGGRVSGLAVDPGGQTAAAVTESGETVLFALQRPGLGHPLANAGHPVTALAVNDNNVVAAGDGQVAWWDPTSGQRRVIPVQGQPVTAVATSTDGNLVATVGHSPASSGNGTFSVSEVPSGKLRFESDWYPGNAFPTAVAMQPGGSFMAIGDGQGVRVRLYDTATGHLVRDLASPSTAIAGLVFAPSGRELVGVTADGELVRWEIGGARVGDPVKLGSAATSLAIAPDGKSVAVATSGGIVVVDLATGTSRPPFTSPFGRIDSLAFVQNGSMLATGGSGHVTLWDVAAGRAIGSPLPVEGDTVVAFDSVTDELITGSDNGEVVVWQVDPARWTEAACRLAGRTLTPDEWHRYLGNQSFRPGCQ